MIQEHPLAGLDVEGFARDLNALRAEVDARLGPEDLRHLRKIELWGRLCTWIGYGTAWLLPNPLSALLISQGIMVRWTIMMHHCGHKGYDKVPGTPERYKSKNFGRGWRRWLDFPDWIEPESWIHEHNQLHHYHTGEEADPDLVERNLMVMRLLRVPVLIKYFAVAFFMSSWKWSYYAGNTLRTVRYSKERQSSEKAADVISRRLRSYYDPRGKDGKFKLHRLYRPFADVRWAVLVKSLAPYILYRFFLIPSLFLLISPTAALYVLLTSLMAEVFTNAHAFLVIVPNHAGPDVYRFDGQASTKAEFYIRQVLGSVNYRTGTNVTDFLHGWLNYQIEHHLFPDLSLLQYQLVQPKVKELCKQYGIPYVQEGVFKRLQTLVAVMLGRRTMKAGPRFTKPAAAKVTAPRQTPVVAAPALQGEA